MASLRSSTDSLSWTPYPPFPVLTGSSQDQQTWQIYSWWFPLWLPALWHEQIWRRLLMPGGLIVRVRTPCSPLSWTFIHCSTATEKIIINEMLASRHSSSRSFLVSHNNQICQTSFASHYSKRWCKSDKWKGCRNFTPASLQPATSLLGWSRGIRKTSWSRVKHLPWKSNIIQVGQKTLQLLRQPLDLLRPRTQGIQGRGRGRGKGNTH